MCVELRANAEKVGYIPLSFIKQIRAIISHLNTLRNDKQIRMTISLFNCMQNNKEIREIKTSLNCLSNHKEIRGLSLTYELEARANIEK